MRQKSRKDLLDEVARKMGCDPDAAKVRMGHLDRSFPPRKMLMEELAELSATSPADRVRNLETSNRQLRKRIKTNTETKREIIRDTVSAQLDAIQDPAEAYTFERDNREAINAERNAKIAARDEAKRQSEKAKLAKHLESKNR